MQGIRTLYGATMGDLKMEKINEGITNLAGIHIMLIIIFQFDNSYLIFKK